MKETKQREIKFRAWDGEEMTDWDEFDGGDMTLEQFFAPDVPVWNVMQFTGLKDKNGKEIYEGDLCKRNKESDAIVEVVYGNHFGQVTIRRIFKERKKEKEVFFNELWKDGEPEIIGNICENPELLTKE